IAFKKFFFEKLQQKLSNSGSSSEIAMDKQGYTFIADLTKLMELFSALRTLPLGPEYEDERTFATIQLINYLKQTERYDKYIEYVHQLCERHLALNNYVEAAFTLLLHADLLDWDSNKVLPAIKNRGFPQETSYERKERLYQLAISYYD